MSENLLTTSLNHEIVVATELFALFRETRNFDSKKLVQFLTVFHGDLKWTQICYDFYTVLMSE